MTPTMFQALSPTQALAPLVLGYWLARDFHGTLAGQPITTSPHPAAVLTVHLGRPNRNASGTPVPKTSLLGIQSSARTWYSGVDSYLIMAMLTPPGLARLFPDTGPDSADRLLDLEAITGDHMAAGLVSDLTAASEPQQIAARLDQWLLGRVERIRAPQAFARFSAACAMLRCGARIETAATAADVSARQLERWCRAHLGVAPKQIASLHRLQASLLAVQTGHGDPLAGFSDQAHQIRTWQRHLGISPGRYRGAASLLSNWSTSDPNVRLGGFSHYL